MTRLIGLSPTTTASSAVDGTMFGLGSRVEDHVGNEYVYVQANGAITGEGYVCTVDETYQAAMLSTANDAGGDVVGIAQAAFADNDYGFLLIKGVSNVRVAASAAANVGLNTTGTVGQLDDDGGTGSFDILGLVLTTANGGAAGLAPAVASYPTIAHAAN